MKILFPKHGHFQVFEIIPDHLVSSLLTHLKAVHGIKVYRHSSGYLVVLPRGKQEELRIKEWLIAQDLNEEVLTNS
jgi:hypothetical protein